MAYVEPILRKCNSLNHIKQLQAHLIITGLFKSCFSRSKLLDFCATSAAAADLPYATYIFNHIPHPATNDWNAIIRGLSATPQPIAAVSCYASMRRASRCRPDALSCSFALKACSRALAPAEILQLHSDVIRIGVGADVLLQTTLLDAYAKCGDLSGAYVLFDEMTVRDVACWNAVIGGMAQGNRPGEALKLFKLMRQSGMKPNDVTVLGALSACSQLGASKEGEKIYSYIRGQRLDANVNVCNAVIDMFAKCGLVKKAYEVFSSMPCKKCLITWNTMVMAYAMHGNGARAVELFNMIEEDGLVPDSVSYLLALCACNHAGMVDEGMRLFESMAKVGVERNVKHYGSVVDLLGRAGWLEQAFRIVEKMPTVPDIVLWQTLLGACKTYGNAEMAEKVSGKLMEMGSRSCGDFVLLSNLYAAQERWDDVGKVRDAMKNSSVKKIPGFSYTEVGGMIYKFINGDQSHPRWKEIYEKLDEVRVRLGEYGYVAETNYVLHDIGQEEKANALFYHSEKLAVAFGLISSGDGALISVNKNLRICGDCHAVIKLISKLYKREIIVRDRTRFHEFRDGICSCGDYW